VVNGKTGGGARLSIDRREGHKATIVRELRPYFLRPKT
jgi:hypothetical protein